MQVIYRDLQIKLSCHEFSIHFFTVKNHYWYQMYLDDLPIWGIVGEIDDKADNYYVWTHKKFEIGYNDDQVGVSAMFNQNYWTKIFKDCRCQSHK